MFNDAYIRERTILRTTSSSNNYEIDLLGSQFLQMEMHGIINSVDG